jgi:hypothetical protein
MKSDAEIFGLHVQVVGNRIKVKCPFGRGIDSVLSGEGLGRDNGTVSG